MKATITTYRHLNAVCGSQPIVLYNLSDLFYAVEDTGNCNFADDTTPHASGFDLKDVMTDIEHDCSILV